VPGPSTVQFAAVTAAELGSGMPPTGELRTPRGHIGAVVALSPTHAVVSDIQWCTRQGCQEQSLLSLKRILARPGSPAVTTSLPCAAEDLDTAYVAAAGGHILAVCSENAGVSQGLVSSGNEVYESSDDGRSWTRRSYSYAGALPRPEQSAAHVLPASLQVAQITMASPLVAYVLADVSGHLRLYLTRNGGTTWRTPRGFTSLPAKSSVAAASGEVAYVSAYRHGFWRTTDAGRQWMDLALAGHVDIGPPPVATKS
jgi:hypothetical protein